MTNKSILGNIIKFDEKTINGDIEKILFDRFSDIENVKIDMGELHDPYLLTDMKKAIDRIMEAYKNKERVVIFGDYDVDGVTSTSIIAHFFKKFGFDFSYRLPDRAKDGYGLKQYFVDELKEKGVKLIITVDCGTRDIEVIKYAKNIGIDVIVTDHHAVPEIIPAEAVAIINPKRKDCFYPFKFLSGVGVAFKLISALAEFFMKGDELKKYINSCLDIVALGTVADCMPLIGENRLIVSRGLEQLRKSRSRGVRSLVEDKIGGNIDADIFGFLIGPRINAAGRMSTPYKALNLLLNNTDTVDQTLQEIEDLNTTRKARTIEYFEDALEKINPKNNIIFYSSEKIGHGIIGIVAGRLCEKFHKPTIVLKDEGDKLVGSCRSPEYFSIIEILEKYKDFFERFGGHKQAAGFSIKKEKFHEFMELITKEMNGFDFSLNKKIIKIDKLVSLEELSFSFLAKVDKFKPFGMGNPKPLFMIKDFKYQVLKYLGKDNLHLTFTNKQYFKIFAFNFGDYIYDIKKSKNISLIFDISEDNWMGKRNLMLKVVDIILD